MAWNLTIEPRSYQIEATNWALARKQVVCCLPTGTGKTLVGVLWLKSLFEAGKATRALILEPIRLLVEEPTTASRRGTVNASVSTVRPQVSRQIKC